MNRSDFQNLAALRLDEAQCLFQAGHYSGAYYLAGYAVECALKACICKQTQLYDFPPGPDLKKSHYSHVLRELIETANLKSALLTERENNEKFDNNWLKATQWSASIRIGLSALKRNALLIRMLTLR